MKDMPEENEKAKDDIVLPCMKETDYGGWGGLGTRESMSMACLYCQQNRVEKD